MIAKTFKTTLRTRLKFWLVLIPVISCLFIIYQLIIFSQLNNEDAWKNNDFPQINIVRGIHKHDMLFYEKRDEGFKCIHSMELIDSDKINDDYCDCLDGSDEPGTNACPNGHFYCQKQVMFKRFPKSISSSRVNDGICDCCDGSDEWQHKLIKTGLTVKEQQDIHRFLSPCPTLC